MCERDLSLQGNGNIAIATGIAQERRNAFNYPSKSFEKGIAYSMYRLPSSRYQGENQNTFGRKLLQHSTSKLELFVKFNSKLNPATSSGEERKVGDIFLTIRNYQKNSTILSLYLPTIQSKFFNLRRTKNNNSHRTVNIYSQQHNQTSPK